MSDGSISETPRLICVEGIGGSGKSTTAQWISIELQKRGHPARWLHESESQNQLRAYFQVEVHTDPSSFVEESLRSWRDFSRQSRARTDTRVLDGSLFQVTTVGLLLHDVESATITDFVREIMTTVDSRDSFLVYLRSTDVTRTLENAGNTAE